ncbi:conserved hypothetical protein [Candidatus Accumulibacter aalborgensis]|uniref:TIR domain-containing protein n=2 Tax=Candidatus Accumulibacter aalborgensis TaxID=1860102 RepID=A0A1A8XNJ8_9PROT|nr:conserved hypothetical protein [Candidatus Accumulibacter aalborgensis]
MGALTTRMQKSLLDRVETLRTDDSLWQDFASAWAGEGGKAFADPEALCADCLQQDPLDLLQRILNVAPKLGNVAAATPARTNRLREVAIGLCLLACERYIRDECTAIGAVAASDGMLIGASHHLAAAVIAAVWCEKGVKLRFDPQAREAAAVNVLPQHVAPLEYGFQGDRDCARAELLAVVNAAMADLAVFDRPLRLAEIRKRGLPSDRVLKRALDQYEEDQGTRLMFGLQTRDPHPMDDPALRSEFATQFGVPTFFYDAATCGRLQDAEADAWKGLQADLLHYLENLFQLIYPLQEAKSMLALEDMHFQVALSFAGEHRPYVREVALLLTQELTKEAVFYDYHFKSQTAVPDADLVLQRIYHDQSDLVVVFLGGNYQGKEWCGLEWRAVRDLIKKRDGKRIMFFRFDDKPVDGVFSLDLAIDCGEHSPAEAAKLISERLQVTPRKP